MKSQRRHELQHNVLADWLGKQLEVVKPYTNIILGAVIALCAVAIIVQLISGTRSAGSAGNWQKFYSALALATPEERLNELKKIEKDLGGTPTDVWVQLSEADLMLDQATAKIYFDRDQAKELIDSAKKHYQKAADAAHRQPLLAQRAQFGLAQAHEAAGEFDEAKKVYSKLIKDAPGLVFGKLAGKRLKRLDSLDVKEFYTQLASHKPIVPKSSPELEGFPGMKELSGLPGLGGLGGMEGKRDFGAPLPDRPDLTVPAPGLDFSLGGPDLTPADGDDPDKKASEVEENPDEPAKKPAEGDKAAEPEKKTAEPQKKPDENPAEPEEK